MISDELAAERYENSCCTSCGAYSDSDDGWVLDMEARTYSCPECVTPEVERAQIQRQLDLVTLGQFACELDDEEYPAELTAWADIITRHLDGTPDDPR